jgi:hypothetical protein
VQDTSNIITEGANGRRMMVQRERGRRDEKRRPRVRKEGREWSTKDDKSRPRLVKKPKTRKAGRDLSMKD